MNRIFSIDRFERQIAALLPQDGAPVHVLRAKLPAGAREGDCVAFQDGAWRLLPEQTKQLREELFALQESLFDE